MRFRSILAASVLIVCASCGKDDDDPPPSSYPKNVNIEYKVTSPSGLNTAGSIIYKNETGGLTTLSNVPLPFSKKINVTVNQYDNVSLTVTNQASGTMKLEILVNNVVAKSQEFQGSPVISGTVPYIFQ